jgi:hypothetical protein
MGTNPSFIGYDAEQPRKLDRLSARLGYKVVSFVFDKQDLGKNVKLVPPHYRDNVFELSDNSKCPNSGRNHDITSCSCGFYAYNNIESAITHWTNASSRTANQVIVEVALSGEVIVAERGYRATHQRVTRLFLPHCYKCGNPADMFAYHETSYLAPACAAHGESNAHISFADFSKQNSPSGYTPLEVVPARNFSKDIDKFKNKELIFQEVRDLIDTITVTGDTAMLDRIWTYANQRLEESVGLGQTLDD